jgi:hypothetical protein
MALKLFRHRLRVSRQFRILVENERGPVTHYTAWEWCCWRFFVATHERLRFVAYASIAGLLAGAGLALLFWALGGR